MIAAASATVKGTVEFRVAGIGMRTLREEATCRAIITECLAIGQLVTAYQALRRASAPGALTATRRSISKCRTAVYLLAYELGFPFPDDATTGGASVVFPTMHEIFTAASNYVDESGAPLVARRPASQPKARKRRPVEQRPHDYNPDAVLAAIAPAPPASVPSAAPPPPWKRVSRPQSSPSSLA